MTFRDILCRAKAGEEEAAALILEAYRPLLRRQATVFDALDEDLYQELCVTALGCIRAFRLSPAPA